MTKTQLSILLLSMHAKRDFGKYGLDRNARFGCWAVYLFFCCCCFLCSPKNTANPPQKNLFQLWWEKLHQPARDNVDWKMFLTPVSPSLADEEWLFMISEGLFISRSNANLNCFSVNSLKSLQHVVWVHRCCNALKLWSPANWCILIWKGRKLQQNMELVFFTFCLLASTLLLLPKWHHLGFFLSFFPLNLLCRLSLPSRPMLKRRRWYGQRTRCTKRPFVCWRISPLSTWLSVLPSHGLSGWAGGRREVENV